MKKLLLLTQLLFLLFGSICLANNNNVIPKRELVELSYGIPKDRVRNLSLENRSKSDAAHIMIRVAKLSPNTKTHKFQHKVIKNGDGLLVQPIDVITVPSNRGRAKIKLEAIPLKNHKNKEMFYRLYIIPLRDKAGHKNASTMDVDVIRTVMVIVHPKWGNVAFKANRNGSKLSITNKGTSTGLLRVEFKDSKNHNKSKTEFILPGHHWNLTVPSKGKISLAAEYNEQYKRAELGVKGHTTIKIK